MLILIDWSNDLAEFTANKIEEEIFELMVVMCKYKLYNQREPFKLHLQTIENLNKEYKNVTGKYFVDNNKILSYYEHLWTMR